MAEVVWTSEALISLATISAYIRHFDPDAANRIYERLILTGDSLAQFPHRGRPASGGTRELPIVPPYILRYEVAGEVVIILNIRHGRQSQED